MSNTGPGEKRASSSSRKPDARRSAGQRASGKGPGGKRPPGAGPGGKRPSGGDGKPRRSTAKPEAAGLAARRLAVDLLTDILHDGRALGDALAQRFDNRADALEPRDRALARATATTALRYARPLREVLARYLTKPLQAKHRRVDLILLASAAQILEQDIAPHAVISLAVDLTRERSGDARLDKLVNAVLRRLADAKADWPALKDRAGAAACLPDWMRARWQADYGADLTERIAEASLQQAGLDISVKADPADWARRLGARRLATGSLRLVPGGRIEELAGFEDGAWWVQDAASALPARLLGPVAGRHVLDLCAAPGGKTAELASAGALVTAVDAGAERQERTRANLRRLALEAEIVTADILDWQPPGPADLILIDAPCSATGTIRRHPDILHLKRESDQAELVALQSRLLARAFGFLAPGGTLVYCTCALERAEGEDRVAAFLASEPAALRKPISAGEAGIPAEWIDGNGDVRILPTYDPPVVEDSDAPAAAAGADPGAAASIPGGIDGFFIARITRLG